MSTVERIRSTPPALVRSAVSADATKPRREHTQRGFGMTNAGTTLRPTEQEPTR